MRQRAITTVLLLLVVRPAGAAARSVSHHGLRSLGLDPGESAALLGATVRALAARPLVIIGPRAEGEEPAPLTVGERTLRADLRYAFGLSLGNLPHGFEVDIAVEIAFGPTRYTPYQVDGRPSFLVEPRTGSEVSVTTRWTP